MLGLFMVFVKLFLGCWCDLVLVSVNCGLNCWVWVGWLWLVWGGRWLLGYVSLGWLGGCGVAV